ncbi:MULTISPECIES: hypothetical protein [Actinomycetaceae]|uniref:Uncharacterized protein n=2 Tax=Actinomycetaceae TaxID=2049 RepID=A0ABZ0RBW1_9ACTO|nr:hypothetical protein [Actinotignum sanguinis]WPJ88883.1 hypothetical protein R0V15_08490 [Schaalia turicensis]MDE1656510.1 hypothetical protein [Actinotignum sanguinis]MDK7198220.1 hypothetical protein [Actinotignum sanguinis]MDK8353945.1 hypothetical protein [Actinotignum sanguinis]MDK8512440.1 hypothetical protein [Actinotignum sanguinis]
MMCTTGTRLPATEGDDAALLAHQPRYIAEKSAAAARARRTALSLTTT